MHVNRHLVMSTLHGERSEKHLIWSNSSLQDIFQWKEILLRTEKWIHGFELYLTTLGIGEKAKKFQVATFLHVAGIEARRVYNTYAISASYDQTIAGTSSNYIGQVESKSCRVQQTTTCRASSKAEAL